jgi:hypothetical protein
MFAVPVPRFTSGSLEPRGYPRLGCQLPTESKQLDNDSHRVILRHTSFSCNKYVIYVTIRLLVGDLSSIQLLPHLSCGPFKCSGQHLWTTIARMSTFRVA